MVNRKKIKKQSIQILIDALLLVLAFCLSLLLRYFLQIPNVVSPEKYGLGSLNIVIGIVFTISTLGCMFLFGCQKIMWRYTSTFDVVKLFIAVLCSCAFLALVRIAFLQELENSFIVIYGFISFLFLALPRFANRIVNSVKHAFASNRIIKSKEKKVLVFGAGYTGRQLVEQQINNTKDGYIPVVVLDDDPEKKGLNISGLPIIGGRECLSRAVKEYEIDCIIIAIQKIPKKDLKIIYQECAAQGVPVKTVPTMTAGDAMLSSQTMEVRDVKMEELLGREEFAVNMTLINHFIKDKIVLVTGGAGSIGSELCRQALAFECKHLIVFDTHENSVFLLNQEFSQKFDTSSYSLVIGNVREKSKLKSVFERFKPEVVFHAAAYKHVPMMEFSPVEAVKNNVFGTQNVIDQCNASGVKKFVLISSDKAVNPANVMGATKRIAEMLVQTRAETSHTQLAAVRFGNVLGSNGSVVGIFLEQIRNGGPVTLTHPDIKRYFMTIPEAVRLVMQAGALASSGEVFVLDMGEPVLIYDLAVDLIKMNGLLPEKDIEIKTTGLRPGEKLFEELKFDGESCNKTLHEGIFVCKLETIEAKKFGEQLKSFVSAVENEDALTMVRKIFEVVPSAYRQAGSEAIVTADSQAEVNEAFRRAEEESRRQEELRSHMGQPLAARAAELNADALAHALSE